MMPASSIGIILAAYVLTLGLTICVRNILLKRGVFDKPNKRSSHKTPVPRGGGWALLAVVVPGMIIAGLVQQDLASYSGLIAGAISLAYISWIDDRKGGIGIVPRLGVQIIAACLGSIALPAGASLFHGAIPYWLDLPIMIIGWAWFMNLYNFMDGIDGITGVETVSIAIGVSLIFTLTSINDPFADTLCSILTGAGLGFLALNWHPAKVFLGDVGSVPLGYLTGFLLITLAVKCQWAPALIIPSYYLADSGITLAKRILRGEKFWQAHRQHFYQHAAQRVKRHDWVVIWIAIANVALIGAACVAVVHVVAGLVLAVCVVAGLLWKMSIK
jgi:UDP-N-acetylmuramyl pentapeptide phosphotransferase/UDP-N-acetylglucosamine-1-phosphate transferase